MTIRIGLLGASRIAPRAIIEPASKRDDVVIAAVAARDPDRARTYAQEHDIPHIAGDYAELAARDDIDLIYCALPPAAHLDPCLDALSHGKALLVEKPFAMNAGEAARIAAAAEQAGRPALEAFHYRFHSLFADALDVVRRGEIGRIVHAEGEFDAEIGRESGELRWKPALGGGGTMDLGCYVVHALRTLIGEEPMVTNATATLVEGVDAIMDANLIFPGGATARTHSSMKGPRRDRIVLTGDRGALTIENFVAPQRDGRLIVETAAGRRSIEAEGASTYDAQLAHVVAVLRDGATPLTGGEDAVATMRVLDAMRSAVGVPIVS